MARAELAEFQIDHSFFEFFSLFDSQIQNILLEPRESLLRFTLLYKIYVSCLSSVAGKKEYSIMRFVLGFKQILGYSYVWLLSLPISMNDLCLAFWLDKLVAAEKERISHFLSQNILD